MELLVIHLSKTSGERSLIGVFDPNIHKYSIKILHEGNLEEFNIIKKIKSVITEIFNYKPDVLIISGYSDFSLFIAAVINKLLAKKNIFTSDTTKIDRTRTWYKESIKKILLKIFDHAFCIGTSQKEYLETLGFESDRISCCGWYAVDNSYIEKTFNFFKSKKQGILKEKRWKEKNFIFVGRLSHEKNLKLLLRAFASVRSIKNNEEMWGLILVGDGPQRKELEDLIKYLNLKDVYLVGGIPWRDVPKYYALADVFVLPSTSEPWGLVVNEAMICGLPVIISKRAGAYSDLVREGENGFGFDPYNQHELQEILQRFIENKVNIQVMSENARKIIHNYTPEKEARKMFESIKTLVEKGARKIKE